MARVDRVLGLFLGATILSLTTLASADTVRGKGRVMYYQNGGAGGAYLPFDAARIHLIDDDGIFGGETMRTGYTDETGNFDLTGSGGDWFSKPDPYIQVELETSGGGVVVESEILKINVTCSTPTRDNTAGTINFGTFNCAGNAKDGSTIFQRLRKAYATFRSLTGEQSVPRHDGKAAALFPCALAAGVPWTTEESIHWPGGYRTFDAVFHEFGHRVRHAQDGDFWHFLGDVASYSYTQQHWTTKVTNDGFAFNEGWAEYNAAVNGTANYQNWGMVNSGANNVEGNVAAKLWRASQACGGYKEMWTALKRGNIHSWAQFAANLRAVFNGSAALRAAHPHCLENVIAENDATPSSSALALNDAPLDALLLGAFAPSGPNGAGPTVSHADQTALLARVGANAKSTAATRPFKNPFANTTALRALGGRVQQARRAHEIKLADKLAQHAAKLTPIEATKEAVEKRKAEHVAFVREILRERIAYVEQQGKELAGERRAAKGRDGDALDKTQALLAKRLNELRTAEAAGVMQRELMPASFSEAIDAAQP
jgi:hypothetical protein